MEYLIFSDVSLDIDVEFAQTHDVRYIPMEYVLGEDTFHCERPESDEMMHNYYQKLREKVKTQTSQITPMHYMEVFEPLVKEGNAILYLSLSSGLSNAYESALLAAHNIKEDYPEAEIEIVDSLSATGGMGLLIESAFKNRDAGMNLKDNAAWLREHTTNVIHWFMVEDLMYLKRGGRVSATTAIVGTALNIKPILRINPIGKLETIDKKRGSKLAIKAMIERFEKDRDPSIDNTVYISCADCMGDAQEVKKTLLEKHPELTVRTTMLSPIIGAHTGPGMLAIIYYGAKRTE